ncbi:MAG: hypothetical protein KDF65_11145 [Anaerolineae bacterium]|nr:hypothetical protein [Anaerolineae bacterium]
MMSRRIIFLPLLLLFSLVAGSFGAASALADEGQQATVAQELSLFTTYPAQEVAIGENVTLPLVLRTVSSSQVAQLQVKDLPEGWQATFKGAGRIVEAAYVEPENDTKVDLLIDPPPDAAAGVYRFTVMAQGEAGQSQLPVELTLADKLPPSMALSVELPTLNGGPDSTFRYNTTLKNEGDQDMTVNLVAEAPPGFQVNFKLNGQDVTSIPLAANESKKLSVEAKAFPDTPAGAYPINIAAQGSEAEATLQVTAEVTGQPDLTVTAPDGRLSGQAYVGDVTPLKLVVQNTGSAPARNIELSATSPTGWQVDFEPKQLAEVGAGKQVEVTANLHPAEQAIAGDYVVNVKAKPEDGPTKTADFRITVLTSTMWGIVGVGLIAVAVVVVGLAVMRFGRR